MVVCASISGMRKALFALPLLVMLAGCGGSSSSTSAALTPNLQFTSDVTSNFKNLKTYTNGATDGYNQLSGTTTINGQTATVETQAVVNYVNGSGPFNGLITVTLPDSSAISMKMDGTAVLDSGSGVTTFNANLITVGGSGSWANSSGTGTFTGTRSTALGGAVHMDVALALH